MSSKKEAPAAAAGTAPKKSGRRMKLKHKLILIIISLLMIAVLHTGYIFFLIVMLPSVVMYYLDRGAERYKFKAIFACNLAGALPFLGRILYYGPKSGVLQEIMSSPSSWLLIYGAAGFGALITNITPLIAQMMIGGMHQTQINRLERSQKKIESEWGHEVSRWGQQDDAD